MRLNNKRAGSVGLSSTVANASAKVYDFGLRQTKGRDQRRIRELKHENALLRFILSETRTEIERLRNVLAAP
jgi:hypothetical protein